jgi:tetratricopeptide (TPR) repeat protein
MLYLLAGKFLGQHGQKERSHEFLQYAATSRYGRDYGTHMAMDALRKQNIPIEKMRIFFVPDSLHPLIELLDESIQQSVAGDLSQATALLTDLLKQRSDFLPGLMARSYAYECQDVYVDAIADLEEAIRIDPRFFYAHIQLARILSTCEKAEFRNGKQALQLAKRAAELGQRDTKAGLEVMASALAECGQFDQAAEAQTRASKLPNPDKSSDERLKLYAARKPYHGKPTEETPWPSQPGWFYRD